MTPSGGASSHLGTFLRVSPPAGSATALGVTFWVPTHALKYLVTYFESVSAFLLTLHPVALGVTFLLSRICPTGVSGAAGALHESGCPSLVLLLWP